MVKYSFVKSATNSFVYAWYFALLGLKENTKQSLEPTNLSFLFGSGTTSKNAPKTSPCVDLTKMTQYL